jgi:hypothetical protein
MRVVLFASVKFTPYVMQAFAENRSRTMVFPARLEAHSIL